MIAIRSVCIEIGLPALAVILIANFPILDPERRRTADSQKIILIVWIGSSRETAQPCPIPNCSPVDAFFINAKRDVVCCSVKGRVAIGVRYPGGGFVGLPAAEDALSRP